MKAHPIAAVGVNIIRIPRFGHRTENRRLATHGGNIGIAVYANSVGIEFPATGDTDIRIGDMQRIKDAVAGILQIDRAFHHRILDAARDIEMNDAPIRIPMLHFVRRVDIIAVKLEIRTDLDLFYRNFVVFAARRDKHPIAGHFRQIHVSVFGHSFDGAVQCVCVARAVDIARFRLDAHIVSAYERAFIFDTLRRRKMQILSGHQRGSRSVVNLSFRRGDVDISGDIGDREIFSDRHIALRGKRQIPGRREREIIVEISFRRHETNIARRDEIFPFSEQFVLFPVYLVEIIVIDDIAVIGAKRNRTGLHRVRPIFLLFRLAHGDHIAAIQDIARAEEFHIALDGRLRFRPSALRHADDDRFHTVARKGQIPILAVRIHIRRYRHDAFTFRLRQGIDIRLVRDSLVSAGRVRFVILIRFHHRDVRAVDTRRDRLRIPFGARHVERTIFFRRAACNQLRVSAAGQNISAQRIHHRAFFCLDRDAAIRRSDIGPIVNATVRRGDGNIMTGQDIRPDATKSFFRRERNLTARDQIFLPRIEHAAGRRHFDIMHRDAVRLPIDFIARFPEIVVIVHIGRFGHETNISFVRIPRFRIGEQIAEIVNGSVPHIRHRLRIGRFGRHRDIAV